MIDRDNIIRMALETGMMVPTSRDHTERLERFAALVAAAEREKVERWEIGSGFTPGPENNIEDVLVELEYQIREDEREACAKVCSDRAMHCELEAQRAIENGEHDEVSAIRSTAWQISVCAADIRARGQACPGSS